jgi:transposase-like protein
MPAKSRAQQKAMAMALAAKRRKIPVSKLKGAAKQMYKSMSVRQLEEFATISRKGLPRRVRHRKGKG